MSSADDLVHIRSLYDRYNHGIDSGDGAMFASCFTDDASLNTMGEPMVGLDAIAAFAEGTHAAMPDMRHEATNIVIDIDGDEASGAAFLKAFMVPDHTMVIAGRYADRFRRTADGWRISDRVFTADGS
ncbi:MAG: nuclear transport factor 2 family protein [Actinomycetota bacterium]